MLLWVDMIEAKTSIRLLRHLGIALIALPDPFTTVFGVALVLASRYLSRRREANRNKRLRETVKYYLSHSTHFSGDADGKSRAPGSVKRHAQSKEPAILGQITGSRSFAMDMQSHSRHYGMKDGRKVEPRDAHREVISDSTGKLMHHSMDMQSLSGRYKAGDSFKVESGWSGTSSRAEKVIHHTINMEWFSRCHEGEGSAVARSNWATTSGAVEGAAHHSVNMRLLSQRYKTGGVGQAEVKHHTINMALLLRHYESAASAKEHSRR